MQAKLKLRLRNLAFILLLGLLVLASVPLARNALQLPMVFRGESQNALRLGELVLKQGLSFTDQSVLPPKQVIASPLLGLFGLLSHAPMAWLILMQIALGLLLLAGVWALLLRLNAPAKFAFLAAIVLAISPGFSANFSRPIIYVLPLVFLVYGSFFWISQNSLLQRGLGVLLLALTALMGFWWMLYVITIVVGFSILVRLRLSSIGLVAAAAATGMLWLSTLNSLHYSPISFVSLASIVAFDLGGVGLLSVGSLILGLIGILTTWSKQKGLHIIYLLIILSFIETALFSGDGSLLLVIFPIFAGFMLFKLMARSWVMPSVKYATYLFAFFILILSMVIAILNNVNSIPNQEEMQALQFLRAQAGGVVLAAPEYSELIQGVAHKTVLDFSNPEIRNATSTIFHSQNLRRTLPKLNQLNISFIFLTPKTKQGLIWSEDNKGLQFLLRNNETFKRALEVSGVEVWEVLR